MQTKGHIYAITKARHALCYFQHMFSVSSVLLESCAK